MAEAEDLKSSKCGFDPHRGHVLEQLLICVGLEFRDHPLTFCKRQHALQPSPKVDWQIYDHLDS